GDTNYTGSSDSNFSYVVTKANAHPALSVAPTSGATVDTLLTLTTTVKGNGSAALPTGTVEFDVDGTPVIGCGAVSIVNLKAVCNVPAPLPAGSYTIAETYSGDTSYVSTETQVSYTVGQASPTVALAAAPSSGADSASDVKLTANISGSNGAPAATGT